MNNVSYPMRLIADGFGLAEAPVWDDERGSYLVSDPRHGGVWSLHNDGTRTAVVPHRRGVGGVALHADGGVVVSGRNVAWKHADHTSVLGELNPAWGLTRFNDLGTDLEGRVYVGSLEWVDGGLSDPRPGFLHRIDLSGVHVVDDNIGTANGIAVSPEGDTLYVVDTRRSEVLAYDHAADGTLSRRRTLVSWPGAIPDGIAVSADGTVWVALGTGDDAVAVVDPDGVELQRIPVPAAHVTSVCFGGEHLKELAVTSANGVYTWASGVSGFPVPRARVRPPVTGEAGD